jgi:predicted transcriptional regulator
MKKHYKYSLTPFGVAVKKALLDRRMTQKEFCDRYGIPYNRFIDMLYGFRPVNKYREKVKELLGVQESA